MNDESEIIEMWRAGLDTRAIASLLWVRESEVYNVLAQRRRSKRP